MRSERGDGCKYEDAGVKHETKPHHKRNKRQAQVVCRRILYLPDRPLLCLDSKGVFRGVDVNFEVEVRADADGLLDAVFAVFRPRLQRRTERIWDLHNDCRPAVAVSRHRAPVEMAIDNPRTQPQGGGRVSTRCSCSYSVSRPRGVPTLDARLRPHVLPHRGLPHRPRPLVLVLPEPGETRDQTGCKWMCM